MLMFSKISLTGMWLGLLPLLLPAQEEAAASKPETPQATVKLKDGSQINGEVVEMTGGKLKIKTDFGGDVPVDWTKISEIVSRFKLRLVLTDGRTLDGTVQPGEGGALEVRTEDADDPILVPFTAVSAINPPAKKPITYTGNINVGANVNDGNSQTKAASANAELVIRTEDHRLTVKGTWNFAEDRGEVSARNARGSIKYDYFIVDRFYIFTSVLVEGDSLKDLDLRTDLSGGFGYQFIEKGDFQNEHLAKLEAYGEVGASYFVEDFENTKTNSFASGRWSIKLDWEFLPDRISFFHYHEGYPSFEDSQKIYIITEQGLRFTIWNNFVASVQVNWRWDNRPAAGVERSDTLYLFTLGYKFDL